MANDHIAPVTRIEVTPGTIQLDDAETCPTPPNVVEAPASRSSTAARRDATD
jgi:hypothetical protein